MKEKKKINAFFIQSDNQVGITICNVMLPRNCYMYYFCNMLVRLLLWLYFWLFLIPRSQQFDLI